MQIKKITVGIALILGAWILGLSNACASTWYVRDGGGDNIQCTGTSNAVYSGSGNGQACAFSNPRYALGWDIDNPQPGRIKGGDTVFIDGDSDINPGQQAQYLIGYDDSGAGETPTCSSAFPYDCVLANIPAGLSASQPTSIIGTGSHKPQLWGNERLWQVLDANNNYITLKWLEITDHQACSYVNPVKSCNYGGPYPYGAWSEDGIVIGGTGLTMTDVYVHGIGRYGINVPDGVTSMGSATFTRLYVIGNGYGGFTTGLNNALSGTWTFNQPIIEWNGCIEAYPVTNGIDNPSNYSQCFGQSSGGYGDGLAFGPNGNLTAGNWSIIGPGSISFNVQDGFDTLHGNGNGTMQIDKMRFEGNGGQQVKMNAFNANLTNSLIIGDCGWWYNAPQSAAGAMKLGDACRANGDAILFNVTNGSTANILNNTILSNGNVVAESSDGQSTGCNSSTAVNFKNNIVLGGYSWGDDTAVNGSGGNAQTTYIYNDGSDGNGAGTCGTLKWNEDYNIVDGTKNNNANCAGAHDKCGVSPGFSNTIPMGTAGGALNTFYQGYAASSLLSLSSSSPAIASAAGGLNYWNNGNDYHNVSRTNPPSMGGLEANSCAVNGTGCFSNSDCCTGTCSVFFCGAGSSKSIPVVSITSPASGINLTSGNNITITATASEANGSISNISIYNGSTLLGSSSSSTYSYVMNKPLIGIYSLTAKATDANGVSTTSAPVIVTVVSIPVLPSSPVVTITSPGSGSIFTAGTNVSVMTTASETNGTISKIAIYNGSGTLLGVSSSSPYNYVSINTAAGTYTLYAVATDANGLSTTSSPINFTVTGAPVVSMTSPKNGSNITAGSNITLTASASETNGTITQVQFFNGTTLLGSDSTSNYSFTWPNVPAGTYTLTAKAIDSNGASTTSAPVTLTVMPPSSSPVVTIISPGSGSSFIEGSNITVVTTASEINGTVSKIAIYNGSGTLLGVSSSSPYNYVSVNTAAGTYTLYAVATDANGVSTTSNPITFTVIEVAPTVTITSPGSGGTFTAGSNITVVTSASEINGIVSKIAIYNGSGTLLGVSSSSPYNYVSVNTAAGTYTFYAVATDANGVSTTSDPITFTVTGGGVPTVAITSPGSGSTVTTGSNITITASASETNGSIAQVQFFNGATLLGTDTTSGFSYTWPNVPAGTYTLTAKAIDSKGVSTASGPITVTVTGLPIVTITSPSNGSTMTAGSNMTLSASASEANGTIAQVQFYNGPTLLGSDSTSGYSYTWPSVPAGTYTLTAKVIDSKGVSATSSPISVIVAPVSSSPIVAITSPSNGSSFTAGSNVTISASASETNGSIAQVQFFNGSTLLGSDSSSGYNFTWPNVPAGTYTLTAKAIDSKGVSTTSNPITVTVTGLPVVTITSPSNGSTITASSNLTITANASEANGTIAQVQFFNGTTLLGTDPTSGFSYTWPNVSAGTYTLTAKATDSKGVVTTSNPITVTVTGSPVVTITSPGNGSNLTAGSNLTITASASEANGTINTVFFYNGNTLLGSDSSSGYSYTWVNVPAGTYTLTAMAVDKNDNSKTSSPITITVTPAPVAPTFTSQPSNITITAPAAATFTVSAIGTPAPSYQWMQSVNGGAYTAISGATSNSYTIGSTTTANSGTKYECVISNTKGNLTSSAALLTVNQGQIKLF